VVSTFFGKAVKQLEIREKIIQGKPKWLGVTRWVDDWKLHSDANTDSSDDLIQAAVTIAGVAAELMCDEEDFRDGSSTDERAVFELLCLNAALKTGECPYKIVRDILHRGWRVLSANKAILLEVAARLERRKTLRRGELANLLGRVS
jgi:hypothetical protein